ncbi:hypothetical protein DFH27DRAFT_283869 [Peziza echinospora]|nr:hypothetical protein DFH27DRAFT_283869 [Peziza echinospora]
MGEQNGSVVVKCAPSAHHDAVGTYIAETAQSTIREALLQGGWAGGSRKSKDTGIKCHEQSHFTGFSSPPGGPTLNSSRTTAPHVAFIPKIQPGQSSGPSAAAESFPTVAVEVGFWQTWEWLVEDARLFLLGTGGLTMVVVVVRVTEEPSKELATDTIQATPSRKTNTKQRKFVWPDGGAINVVGTAQVGHQAPLTVQSQPHITDTADEIKKKMALVKRWYLAQNAGGHLRPRLVGRISAVVYAFRRKQRDVEPTSGSGSQDMAPDDDVDTFTDPFILMSSKHPFLLHDTPISEATLPIPISHLYGRNQPMSHAHSAQIVEWDMTALGEAITEERSRMEQVRAWKRAEEAIKQALMAAQSQRRKHIEATKTLDDKTAAEEPDAGMLLRLSFPWCSTVKMFPTCAAMPWCGENARWGRLRARRCRC